MTEAKRIPEKWEVRQAPAINSRDKAMNIDRVSFVPSHFLDAVVGQNNITEITIGNCCSACQRNLPMIQLWNNDRLMAEVPWHVVGYIHYAQEEMP